MSASYAERYYRSHDGLELYYRDYAAQGGRAALPVLCLPDLCAVTVANRGHAPLLDEPDALAALDAFFETLS
jgi:hypothetical protein